MKKVITYGTFDLLHYGHIRLLERAKELGDYLIVGVTSDDFDIGRGKINNHDTLMERIEAVEKTGLADEIIIEEYEGQKIDDIKKYNIDIFTVGDDWKGKFDYLSEYCEVVYLSRTQGVSSTELRAENRSINLKIVGVELLKQKFKKEAEYVNGIKVSDTAYDAIFIINHPNDHFNLIKHELNKGKHVLVESPIVLKQEDFDELFQLAKDKNLILMDSIKTAYALAYNRLLNLVKSGKIGKILSVDTTCTSLKDNEGNESSKWNTICAWGPTALLPIFQLLGTKYRDCRIVTKLEDKNNNRDGFTKIDFIYDDAVASIKIAKSAKSDGSLVITGSKGYIYVPSPWWKTDYFEVRFEDLNDTKKYFYQLDGEGIRNELLTFAKSIETRKNLGNISQTVSKAIVDVVEQFTNKKYIEIE